MKRKEQAAPIKRAGDCSEPGVGQQEARVRALATSQRHSLDPEWVSFRTNHQRKTSLLCVMPVDKEERMYRVINGHMNCQSSNRRGPCHRTGEGNLVSRRQIANLRHPAQPQPLDEEIVFVVKVAPGMNGIERKKIPVVGNHKRRTQWVSGVH